MVLCDTACFKYCKQNKMTFFQILTIISIPGKKNTVKEWSLTLYPEEPWFHRVFIVFCPGCYPLHWLLPTMRGCIHKPRLRSSLSLSCRVLYTETDRYLTSWEFHIALSWDRPPRVLMFRLKPPPPLHILSQWSFPGVGIWNATLWYQISDRLSPYVLQSQQVQAV